MEKKVKLEQYDTSDQSWYVYLGKKLIGTIHATDIVLFVENEQNQALISQAIEAQVDSGMHWGYNEGGEEDGTM